MNPATIHTLVVIFLFMFVQTGGLCFYWGRIDQRIRDIQRRVVRLEKRQNHIKPNLKG